MSAQSLRTQVAIIGGGPSGLLLSQLLNKAGVETIILERASRDHVLSRIRAGVLESGTVRMLEEAGVAGRLHLEGHPHEGCWFTDDDLMVRIDFAELTGKTVTVYGQTEVTRDLYAAQDATGTPILHEVSDVVIEDADSTQPVVSFVHNGQARRLTERFLDPLRRLLRPSCSRICQNPENAAGLSRTRPDTPTRSCSQI